MSTFIMSAFGTGMFGLHHVFQGFGIFNAIFILIIVALLFYLVCDILSFSYRKFPHSNSFSILIQNVLGQKYGVIFNSTLILFLLLSQIGLFITFNNNFYMIFQKQIWDFFSNETNKDFISFNKKMVYLTGSTLFIMHLKRNLSAFRYFSLFSFMIYIFITFVIIIQTLPFYNKIKETSAFKFFKLDFCNNLSKLGTVLFSFYNLGNFVEIAKQIRDPSIRRLRKLTSRTYIIIFIFYLSIGLCSYLSLGEQGASQVDLFIFRINLISKDDQLMQLGRSFLLISLLIAIILMAFPLKVAAYEFLGIENNFQNNCLISLAIIIMQVLVSLNVNDITALNNIAGSFCVTITAFTLPLLMAIKIGYVKTSIKIMGLKILMAFLTSLGFLAGAKEIYITLTKNY